MGPNWADIIMALSAVGSLVVTGIGLCAVYVQLKKVRESVWGDTHGRLCEQSIELLRFLAEKRETYDYIYAGKELEPKNPDRVHVLFVTEAIVNFLEHLVLQKDNLPEKQWMTWRRFIVSTYAGSPVIRDFITSHREWYSEDLLLIANEFDRRTLGGTARSSERAGDR